MISILVPNWCSGPRLRQLLATLPSGGPPREVLVCDNASDDGSAEGLPDVPGLAVERPGRNLGFAGAVNLLGARARGDVLLVLNPDCQLLPDTLPRLEAFLATRPGAALVGLCLVDAGDGRPQARYAPRRLPGVATLAAEALGLRRLASAASEVPAASRPAEHLAGAALAITADAFRRLGGMDEGFWPAWFEDVDLSRRARDAGLSAWYCAEARVRHEGGYSRERLGYGGLLHAYYGNLLRYAGKHHGAAATLLLRASILAGMLVRSAAVLVRPASAGSDRRTSWRAFVGVMGVAVRGAHRGHHHRQP